MPDKQPMMVWSVSDLFRLEVSVDVLPLDVGDLRGLLDAALMTIERRARDNAYARQCYDPIYLGA